jgi:hypothetical protein
MVVYIEENFDKIELIENKKKIKSNNHLILDSLKKNLLIDNVLHIVTVISNICEFRRRWDLMKQFIERTENLPNVKLYVVELAYGNQEFRITSSTNPSHLQLRTEYALWHKENMINLGIKKLLPPDWKAVAWIDGDIEFENPNWVIDTLKVLTNFDVIQLFTTCFDLDENEIPMSIWQSFGYKYCHGEKFNHVKGINYWHTGYAWACTKEYYDKVNGLYDKGILGSGDYIMCQGYFGKAAFGHKSLISFRANVEDYIVNLIDTKIGYIPTNIRHYFHGSKVNRKYIERNTILINYNYNPYDHIEYDEQGILVPSPNMPKEFLIDIYKYFKQRNEDEYYDMKKNYI